ncbi:MAG TPA: ABC transporter substrate-binding protein [Candidatus Binataceae bacterium]|nr:ABC transporter substrate-binding protein [Candidatus Binataceae bacterium]
MRPRRFPLAVALAAMLGLSFTGCRVNRPPNDHAVTQTLYNSTTSDPRTFNPMLVTDSASGAAVGDLFEGLVKDNPKTTLIEPDLAQSWEISDGGKTITFYLRHGVKWSDGVPFTSHDVLFTMRAVYDPRVPNSYRFSLLVDGKPIKVEAPDDYTVVMRLPRPFAPLLYSIGVPIVPAHVLAPVLDSGQFNRTWGIDTPPSKLVSLGAYKMERYVPGQMIPFRRNSDYWMRDENGGQLPRLRGQVQLIVPDQNAQYLRFLGGLTDVYSPRPEEVFGLRERERELNIEVASVGIDTGSLFFAFNRNPRHYVHNGITDPRYRWFTDRNFMRAMAHAVDKQGMINLCFRGLGVAAVSDVSPANKIFYNPNLKDYDYDLKLAGRILDEAGYRMLRPGVRGDPQGNPLIFNLTTNTGVNIRDEMCAIFKQDLAVLGIQVNYRPLEFITLVKALDSSFDWDCVLIGFTGGIEPNNGANFLSSSGNLHLWNPAQPKPATPWEAEIDRLLDEGTRVMDPMQRAPYYWRIQQILHYELPIIETVRQISYVAYRNTLENYDPTVWGLYKPEWIQFRAQ